MGVWVYLAVCLLANVGYSTAVVVNPCLPAEPVQRGKGFVLGLAWWPGGTLQDWDNGTHPCNPAHTDRLAAAGVQWGTYNTRVDQLQVLKVSYLETNYMMSKAQASKPTVMTVVAFRGTYRSEPRYVMSLDANTTNGVGFVVSLALLAKFDKGNLRYLTWYDLKCNECGGYSSSSCIAKKSCAMAPSNCTCSDSSSDSSSNATTSCDLNNKKFAGCATSINLAFEGVDKDYQAFQTAAQVRKLNEYSLISMYGVGKTSFFSTKDYLTGTFTSHYTNFMGDLQSSQSTFASQFQNTGASATIGS